MPATRPLTSQPVTESLNQFPHNIRLLLECDFVAVRRVANEAHAFLVECRCTDEDIIDCELALAEACNNAIKYARDSARDLPVRVDIGVSPTEIQISVTDHTPGFDWPAWVAPPDLECERGRGVFLIQSVMFHAEYRRGDAENNLLMTRRRAG
jgi:anti-sigma regulatory factor (Ser/Thr protein kinase)